ncbi:MAG: phosphomannomutase/phosphoglucomutase [Firmicutes bacterium]|nr:phosphomannomutase/phosphoglucomutase [Bacillota bacterium]
MKDYRRLQNGSDIRGVAIVDRGQAAAGGPVQMPNLTEEAAADIAAGFLAWLCRRTGKKPQDLKLAIGRDPRITGAKLTDGLMHGFGPYGCRVLDCGLASTPAMFMATVFPEFACDGTIMITASHLPFNRNGFKFFTPQGGLNKQDITQILEFAEGRRAAEQQEILGNPANAEGFVHRSGEIIFPAEEADIITPYSAHLRRLIIDGCGMGDQPLEGLKITVDAGNGAGGFYARKVLRPLGADISSSQYLDPDGMFLNHAPNPEDKEAMASVSMRTLASQSDLGLIFDTDVDRSAAVDSRGREIARNGIVAMAAALVAEDHPGTTVVTDSITSRQLTAFLEKDLGLSHLRFKRGYRNVINKAVELNEAGTDCQLAIETSGHAALKENYFLDDGAYLATKIVIRTAQLKAEGRRIESLIESLQDPADEKEIRIPITATDFGGYGDKVLEDLEAFAKAEPGLSLEEPNYEGVRINFPEGWCLLRKSLHDPILPMNMASDRPGGCAAIEEVMMRFLRSYDGLEL